jgi:MSHA biogenesis protein MshP
MFPKKNNQQGSALVIAIFVIIVMTLLGLALVRMINASSEAIVYEVLGTRAFQSAQTGLQWTLQQTFPLGDSSNAASCAVVNVAVPPTLTGVDGLAQCWFEHSCTSKPPVDGVTYYTLESTGQCEDSGVITSRKLEVEARSL